MTPERITALIAQFGQPVTLQRLTGTTTQVRHDVVCQGIVRGYEPVQLIGGITQGDRQVAISNAEIARAQWPGPPRSGGPVRDRRAHHHHPGLRHPQAPRRHRPASDPGARLIAMSLLAMRNDSAFAIFLMPQ